MSRENTIPGPNPPPTMQPPVQFGPGAREALKLYGRELATYRRELPRLLAEGQAGRHAIIEGEEILNIWDTQGDAIQAGRERFGPDVPIFIKMIDPRDQERFALLDVARESECRSS